MSRWGIDDNRIAAALAAVRPDGVGERSLDVDDRDDRIDDEPRVIDDLFARAIWSVLVEPGDSTAGALIAAVGAVTAARLVIDRAPAQTISDATRGEVTTDAATSGVARWIERLRANDVMRSLESAARCRAVMVVPGDAHWPESLDALGDSPPVLLWARGDTALLRRPGDWHSAELKWAL
ncbi:MAG: hypothetical protein C0444_01520 [Microbacterium sp.]|nr:hypothetical protein [Microbacterium sp.]MBA4345875.1 hypothetical protein [Microbacterium sp.]